jgi:hypothetical protein
MSASPFGGGVDLLIEYQTVLASVCARRRLAGDRRACKGPVFIRLSFV